MTGLVSVLDTAAMPWAPEPAIRGMLVKKLHVDEATGGTVQIHFAPPDYGIHVMFRRPNRHYHRTAWERSLCLYGDFPHWEWRDGADLEGEMIVFRRGTFMDRPPLTLHGLKAEPRSTVGAQLLEWSTGGGTGLDDPAAKQETFDVPFDDSARGINLPFTSPRIFPADTLPWQAARPGWKWKPLADDAPRAPACGFLHVAADTAGAGEILTTRGPFAWFFVFAGDLRLQVDGRPLHLREGGFVRWEAPADLRLAQGLLSDTGATLLCVGTQLI